MAYSSIDVAVHILNVRAECIRSIRGPDNHPFRNGNKDRDRWLAIADDYDMQAAHMERGWSLLKRQERRP